MDQFGRFGKYGQGTSGGERSVCGGNSTCEVARAPAGSRGIERRKERHRSRVAHFSRNIFREVAIAGCVCVRRVHSSDQRREIQENRLAPTVCRLEVGYGGGITQGPSLALTSTDSVAKAQNQ